MNILVLGASYGLLPGVKLVLAGHNVTFIGKAEEIAVLRQQDLVLRIPLRKSDEIAEMRTSAAKFCTPQDADPAAHDFIILAMQEPQFADPHVAELTQRIGASGKPCLSIMNLPPPPFLARLGFTKSVHLEGVYSSAAAWNTFNPDRITNASPDPQALRMDPQKPGELSVTLASNFKAAPFPRAQDQKLLIRLARDMSRVKVATSKGMLAPPVRLLAHSSAHIPLAKWPMLIAGNCRCVLPDTVCTIAQAVHNDLAASQAVYDAICHLVRELGADNSIIVPFNHYADASAQLTRPSSAARAIDNGAKQVERIDQLALNLMRSKGLNTALIEPIISLIDTRLEANRKAL